MIKRTSGVLMHITSLPSKYGVGTFGKEAYEFVDFLNEAKFGIWQILPLNLTSYGDSPYQSPSNYGYSYYLIDLDTLVEKGLLTKEDLEGVYFGENPRRVNFEALFNNKIPLLKKAFENYKKEEAFTRFLNNNPNISDFAIFMTLKELNNFKSWKEWPKKYAEYTKKLEEEVKTKYQDVYEFYMWTQYEFLNEYFALKKYANSKNILIMGDIPIYLAYDSVECYKYPELFQFDENHNPTRVAGCPPDCFSADGQLWGNPLYNWSYHKATNYHWWNERINSALKLYDLVRIDHFRGFSGYYSIPAQDKTARNGVWVKGPGFDLFKDKLGYPIIAEDLGYMDDDFKNLMEKVKYPGMKILTQGMLSLDDNDDWRVRNYNEKYFSYTSTHDSETVRQYLDNLSSNDLKIGLDNLVKDAHFMGINEFNLETREGQIDLINELNLASNSLSAMFEIQDLFYIGKEGRMNLPSTLSTDNWSFRLLREEFDNNKDKIIKKMSKLIIKYQRDN